MSEERPEGNKPSISQSLLAKYDRSKPPSEERPQVYVMSIRRKAEIMKEDLRKTPPRFTQSQRCEEISTLCELLENSLAKQL